MWKVLVSSALFLTFWRKTDAQALQTELYSEWWKLERMKTTLEQIKKFQNATEKTEIFSILL